MVLQFDLTAAERKSLQELTEASLQSRLRLAVEFGWEQVELDLRLQGPGKKKIAERVWKIAEFVTERIGLVYVPSVRTPDMAVAIIRDMVADALGPLRRSREYDQLLAKLRELEQPHLDRLGEALTETARGFLGEVERVTIQPAGLDRAPFELRDYELIVDDGVRTPLEQKGDGVKSLLAIALFKYASEVASGDRSLVLAIEEPESHLHPQAVHALRSVLRELAEKQQVLVSTHSPLLVDRDHPSANIIVRDRRAKAAAGLAEVREALGVEVSDNLVSARLVLLVEGPGDEALLAEWLRGLSPRLATAMHNGDLVIDSLGGASALSSTAGVYKSLVCSVHAFLDNDDEARRAAAKATHARHMGLDEVTYSTCPDMKESEVEDLIPLGIYAHAVQQRFGVELAESDPQFRHAHAKWSDRVRDVFRARGKRWDDTIEAQVKAVVADAAATKGLSSLNRKRGDAVPSLARELERRLGL